MTCKECGTEFEVEKAKCPNCGAEAERQTLDLKNDRQIRNILVFTMVLVLAVFLLRAIFTGVSLEEKIVLIGGTGCTLGMLKCKGADALFWFLGFGIVALFAVFLQSYLGV